MLVTRSLIKMLAPIRAVGYSKRREPIVCDWCGL